MTVQGLFGPVTLCSSCTHYCHSAKGRLDDLIWSACNSCYVKLTQPEAAWAPRFTATQIEDFVDQAYEKNRLTL